MTKAVRSSPPKKNNKSTDSVAETQKKAVDWLGILQKTEMRALASISNEITQLIGDTNTSATALAEMILKDAALTSQVLKIANSVVYSPDHKKVKAKNQDSELRRAIVRIGFNGIRCICISIALIDSIVKNPKKQQRLLQCLAQSFHTAVHARNVAQTIAGCRKEDVFIAGLLQNIGELVFWCSPISEMDSYKKSLEQSNNVPSVAAKLLTGMNFEEMSKQLAEAWSLSDTLSDSFDPAKLTKEVKAINLGKMMSAGVEAGWDSKPLHAALNKITKDFNMDIKRAMAMLRKGADEAMSMANEYGPDVSKSLLPNEKEAIKKEKIPCVESLQPVDDIENAEEQLREIQASLISSKDHLDNATKAGIEVENPKAVAKPKNKLQAEQKKKVLRMPDGGRLLEIVDELWDLAEGDKPVANVCKLMADGIHEANGFERVAVFIKVNKKEEIKLAFLAGSDTGHWTKDLVLPVNESNESIFRYGVKSDGPVWVDPDKVKDLDKLLTPTAKTLIGEQKQFVLSPIKSGLRVVALVYADMAGEELDFSEEHFSAFTRVIKQAGRALSSL